jgi:hypothetical protein
MAPRRQKPLERVLEDAAFANLSDDKGQRLIFDYYKRAGYLPAKDAQGHTFKSLQEYLSTVQRLAEQERRKNPNAKPAEWLKAAEARLGFNRQIRSAKTSQELSIVAGKQLEDPKQKFAKNRVGSVFPLEIGDNGKVRFNKRKYMSAEGGLPRPVYDLISSKHGQEVADTYQKAVRKEWKTMGDVGRELAAKTGIPFDRGHWLSNKYGGAESARAGALEIAVLNRLHGAAPRGNIERLKVTGRTSSGWLDDFYEWDFTNNKLNVLGSEHLKVADLQEIVNGTKDPNQIAAQRLAEWEARGRTPDPDPIGNIFGSQLGEETINQQRLRMMEEQLDSISKTGIDPQTGNPVSPERLNELQRGAESAKKSTKLIPKEVTRNPRSGGSSSNSNLLRIARNTAPMWASLPLGAAVLGQSAHAAVTNPNADTIETALWDTANLGADALSLVPIPMVAAGAEGAQKILGITQAAREGQKFVQQQGLKPQPSAPRPTAVPQAQTRQRTATAARTQGQVMPKAKPLNLANEGQYFIVNPIRSAFGSIFGKREI